MPGPRLKFAPQHVELIDEVMYDFPELVFVTRHGCEPWADLAVKLMLKWPNLYYSTSAFAPKYYPKAIIDYANTRGADKIIYAGYFPMGLSLERIMTDMPNVGFKDEVWPKFLRGNAAKVLKLAVVSLTATTSAGRPEPPVAAAPRRAAGAARPDRGCRGGDDGRHRVRAGSRSRTSPNRPSVALGTLYRYFVSKDHLFAEALVAWAAGFGDDLGAPSDGRTVEKVKALYRRAVRAPSSVGPASTACCWRSRTSASRTRRRPSGCSPSASGPPSTPC